MPQVIVIGGAPGTGKSTLARQLLAHFRGPWIDFGRLREFHLDMDWSNQSPEEESMTYENLLAIVRNYVRHGYTNIVVDDLQDHRIRQIADDLSELDVRVITLVFHDADELRRRIVTRNDGWKNADAAIEWNQAALTRPLAKSETRVDATTRTPAEVLSQAILLLSPEQPDPRA